MAVSKVLFPIIRALQLLTLAPVWGILAWFVHQYDHNNQPIPAEILVLFIAALVGTAWALVSFFQFHHSVGLSVLVFVMDMIVLGGLIAGVVLLRDVRHQKCTGLSTPLEISWGNQSLSWNDGNGWDISFKKRCILLKAVWALGIINCAYFFISALLALFIYRRNEGVAVRDKGYVDDRQPLRRRRWY